MMSTVPIIKPIAKYAPLSTSKPLAVAGTTLKEGSIVYLLHQLSYNFLLTEFYDHRQLYTRIPIHGWSDHLIGPGVFQEWIFAIRSARTPDEQNLEFFQSTETNLFGFRTTRAIVPDEPLLAWFSLPQLRIICEKIKLSKVFKVEELLKSTRCPRCKIEYHYLNVLVAHVLLNQCEDSTPVASSASPSLNFHERVFIRPSPNKRRLIDRSSPATPLPSASAPPPPTLTTAIPSFTPPIIKSTDDVKEKDLPVRSSTASSTLSLAPSDISSYKMSVLDGTHALEFTSMDQDGKQRKAHLCLFCGKIYNRKYGLKIHLRTHTGYKPLQCRICFRPFSDPSNLNKHIRLHSTTSTSSTNTILPSSSSSPSFVSQKRPLEESDESNIDSNSSHLNTVDDDNDHEEEED